MSHLAFLFICVTWGASFILMERSTHAFGALEVGIGRLFGGALVLAAVWWTQRGRHRVNRSDLRRIAGVALVCNALPFVLQPYCVAHGMEHSFLGMLVALVPLATIVVSVPMLGTWPTGRQVAGVAGGFLCILLLVQDGAERGISAGLLALALSVPLSYAVGNTYLKWKLGHLHAVPLTTLVLALAAAWLLPLEFFPSLVERFGLAGPPEPTDWATAISSLILLGVVGTGIAVLMFIHLVVQEGPLFAGMVTYIVPVIALAWGALDGEPITGRQVVAMGGVLLMVALVQVGARRERLPSPKPPAEEELEPHFCPSENPTDAEVG